MILTNIKDISVLKITKKTGTIIVEWKEYQNYLEEKHWEKNAEKTE